MGGVLGRAPRTTGKAALDRPGASFALLSVATAGVILGALRIKRSGSRHPPTRVLASNEELVRLSDGRRVAIASHGDPQGRPLFLFHGTPGSRLGLPYGDGPAKERGVRVVCPDRPGVGRSDPHPGRTIPDYADDVSAWQMRWASGGSPCWATRAAPPTPSPAVRSSPRESLRWVPRPGQDPTTGPAPAKAAARAI